MSDKAIIVENLSKRYRIGLKEQMHDTLVGALKDFFKQPIKNFRNLRRLTKFDEEPETVNGDSEIDSTQPSSSSRFPLHDFRSSPDSRPSYSSSHSRFTVPDSRSDIIWALRDVSFEVKQGEVVGIIGRNGAGKSTLLKILARITEPTSGRAIVNGRIGSLLEVGTGMHPELTGRENIYLSGTILGMTKAEIDRKFEEIVEFAELGKFIDTPVKRYSSGMKVRLGFAIAAHLEPEILLVDEVLAVGDAAFQKKCLGKMDEVAKGGKTVLFVSHNMGAVKSLCLRAMLLDNGQISCEGETPLVIGEYTNLVLERAKTMLLPNDPVIQIDEFTVCGIGPGGVVPLTTKDSITVRIKYSVKKTVRGLLLGFDFWGYDGTPIFRSYDLETYGLGNRDPGEYESILRIPANLLVGGEYRIGLLLGIHRDKWISRGDLWVGVSIRENKANDVHYTGFIHPRVKWEVVRKENNELLLGRT